MAKSTKTIAYSIPVELIREVEDMARRQHCSRSYIVATILREFFMRHANDPEM
ncbi:MAG: hypothetical protein KBT02_10180 [Treponema sp.]|nr:hypothetical protein [Candidatus Treponema caballi]